MSSILLVTYLETTRLNPFTPTKLPPPRPSSRPRPRILFPCHVFHFPVLMIHSALTPLPFTNPSSRVGRLRSGPAREKEGGPCVMPSAAQIPRHDGSVVRFLRWRLPRSRAGRAGGGLPGAPGADADNSAGGCGQRMQVHDGNASQRTCLWHGRELRQKLFFRRKERGLRGAPALDTG